MKKERLQVLHLSFGSFRYRIPRKKKASNTYFVYTLVSLNNAGANTAVKICVKSVAAAAPAGP